MRFILDTPAKQTIWLDLIPLLEEDDQEYCKRMLVQPSNCAENLQPQQIRSPRKIPVQKNIYENTYCFKRHIKNEDNVDCQVDNLFTFKGERFVSFEIKN